MRRENEAKYRLCRTLASLPINNLWFSSGVGFVAASIYFVSIAIASRAFGLVDIVRLMHALAAVIGVVILVTMWNKWRLGAAWSNQLPFERITTLIGISCFGIAAAALVNNAIATIVMFFSGR